MTGGRIERVFLDMDGVLTDFVGAMLRLLGREEALQSWPPGVWDMPQALRMEPAELWGRIAREGERFWAELEAYPWVDELLGLVAQFAPFTILSSPSSQPESLSGKLRWLQKRFGPAFRDYLIGPPKHLCARPDVVLIDDSDENVSRFRLNGGHAILFPQPWNSNHGLVERRLDYVRDELTRLSGGT